MIRIFLALVCLCWFILPAAAQVEGGQIRQLPEALQACVADGAAGEGQRAQLRVRQPEEEGVRGCGATQVQADQVRQLLDPEQPRGRQAATSAGTGGKSTSVAATWSK